MRPFSQNSGGVLAGCALILSVACGGGANDASGTTPSGGMGGSSGASGGGGATIGTGGTSMIGNDASLIGTDGALGGGSGELAADAACATETQKGERIPLAMYVLLDSSASMTDFISDMKTTKWDAIRAALSTFLKDPASMGLSVGLQYFPIPRPGIPADCTANAQCGQFGPCVPVPLGTCGDGVTTCASALDCGLTPCYPIGKCSKTAGYCFPGGQKLACPGTDPKDICDGPLGTCINRDYCDTNIYATPAIEVAPLPGAAQPLIDSMTAHMPDGFTPTYAALMGGFAHAGTLAKADPNERVVVVLATDGLPTECDPAMMEPNIPAISGIVSAAATGTPPISTFVVGVFAPAEAAAATMNLNAIAKSGGTNQAYVIDTTQNVQQGFLDALNNIRGTLLSCDFKIPDPPDGGVLDYGLVNVRYTSGSGQSSVVGNVPVGKCDPNKGGWSYDRTPGAGQAPTKIQLCDATCSKIQADPKGSVSILLGCQTVAVVN